MANSVNNLRRARSWVKENGGDLFSTFSSFEWFARQHRGELLKSGQFFPRGGRGGSLVGPEIDRVVIDIIQREAQQQNPES